MMNMNLTNRESLILDFISQYQEVHGISPSQREIGSNLSIDTKSVNISIKALTSKGYISSLRNKSRAISLIEKDTSLKIPIIGQIAAGQEIFSEEYIEDYIDIASNLLSAKNKHFALKIKGDSMIDAGIYDGDLAIIKQESRANKGQIVACSKGEDYELLIKKLGLINGNVIELISCNENYGPIRSADIRIFGILALIIRQY